MKCDSRARICAAASCAALPFRSLPVLAAVAEVLATFCVSVALQRTAASGRPSSCATTIATLVFRPWPISVPPWFTSTLPSVYTCTSAPAWFRCVTLKLMPNFSGVSARPFFNTGLAALKALMAARRAR